jgi:hypothetical protein
MTLDATTAGAVLSFIVHWRPQSPNRWTEHWGARQRRHAAAHKAFQEASKGLVPPPLPVVATITRVSRGRADFDNCASSLKPIFDACSEFLGCDDRDPRIEWIVRQAHTSEKVRSPYRYGPRTIFDCFVRVEIAPRAA